METRHVILPGGLAMYNAPREVKAGFIRKIPYATPVTLGPAPDSSDHSLRYTYQGITGFYRQVITPEDTGFVFEPFLSSIPLPAIKKARPQAKLQEYVDTLLAQGLSAAWEKPVEGSEGGDKFSITVPAAGIHEAFLIARILFNIPDEYRFPNQAETILATPQKRSKATENSPYDYVTHSFKLESSGAGMPVALEFEDDSEVGGRRVRISREGQGWKIAQEGWTH